MEQVSRSCLRNDQGRSKMKIWRIILTMLLMSFVCCGQAQADIASGSAGEEILWSLSETGVLTVSGQGEIGNYSMEYSENIKDYITTAPWGKYMEQISSVVIQPGIISVGEKAFSKLIYLKQVTLPDTLVRVENYAFQGSFQIEEILIPDSVTYIGDHAFANLSHLKSFHFPAQLVSLGISAFYNCRMLESVVLPDGFLRMGDSCFVNCVSLKRVFVPSTIQFVGQKAFDGCSETVGVSGPAFVFSFENGVATISGTGTAKYRPHWDSLAVRFEEPLKKAVICDGITAIGDQVTTGKGFFQDCDQLTEVSIPDTVFSLGDYVFSGCVSLKELHLPEGLTHMGDHVLSNCTGLTELQLPAGIDSIGKFGLSGLHGLTELVLPPGIGAVGEYAFYAIDNVREIILPDGCSSIGSHCFMNCTALENVYIPDGIEIIQNNTFRGCPNLREIRLPKTVNRISYSAFALCTNLQDVYIPDRSMNDVAADAFDDVPSTLRVHTYSFSEVAKVAQNSGLTVIPIDRPDNTVFLPNGVEIIEERAFEGTAGEVYSLPDGCVRIESLAFANCPNMQLITIPDSVTYIAEDAFSGNDMMVRCRYPSTAAEFAYNHGYLIIYMGTSEE